MSWGALLAKGGGHNLYLYCYDIAAVGTTFNAFSCEAVMTDNQTNRLSECGFSAVYATDTRGIDS